jgi:3-hydroxybutyryl-CoA dehydratase
MALSDEEILGRVFEVREPYLVTAEKIANFCLAVGETNPLFVDPVAAKDGPYGGIIAPPAFVASMRQGETIFDQLRASAGRVGGLMGGIDIELGTPIRAGDAIGVSSRVKEIYEKTGRTGTMIFSVVRSTLTNQKGEVVAHVDYRMMNRPQAPKR